MTGDYLNFFGYPNEDVLCNIGADSVRIIFWPVDRSAGEEFDLADGKSERVFTTVSDGFTLYVHSSSIVILCSNVSFSTSPSVYVAYTNLGSAPQNTYNTTIPYKAEDLTTSTCFHGYYKAINYTELQYPPPPSAMTGCADPGQPSWRAVDMNTQCQLSYPPNLTLLRPSWYTCSVAYIGGFDPPMVLGKATAMASVATPSSHSAIPGAAALPTYAPATSTSNVAVLRPTPSVVSSTKLNSIPPSNVVSEAGTQHVQMQPDPSTTSPLNSSESRLPSSMDPGTDGNSFKSEFSSSSREIDTVPVVSSQLYNIVLGNKGSTDGYLQLSPLPHTPFLNNAPTKSQDPENHDLPSLPADESSASPQSIGGMIVNALGHALKATNVPSTHTPDNPGATMELQEVGNPIPMTVSIGGSTASVLRALTHKAATIPSTEIDGNHVAISQTSDSLIADQALIPGGAGISVSRIPNSLPLNTVSPLPDSVSINPTNAPLWSSQVKVSMAPFKDTSSDAISDPVIAGHTLATDDFTTADTYAVSTSESSYSSPLPPIPLPIIVNGITTTLQPSTPSSPAAAIIDIGGENLTLSHALPQTFASQTTSLGGSEVIVSSMIRSSQDSDDLPYTIVGQTLAPGGSAITVFGIPISLPAASSGPSSLDESLALVSPSSSLTIGSQGTPTGATSVSRSGQSTLQRGGSAITVDGVSISLQPSGGLIIGDSTFHIASASPSMIATGTVHQSSAARWKGNLCCIWIAIIPLLSPIDALMLILT